MIRPFKEEDRERLKAITSEVFGPSAIDYYIEEKFGQVGGHDWKWRKVRHIDDDIRANIDGVFVFEEGGEILGYVTVVLDREGSMGRIPNLAVAHAAQGKGIGRILMTQALDYIKGAGMALAKIETLIGNEVGEHLYSALGFEIVARQIHFVKEL